MINLVINNFLLILFIITVNYINKKNATVIISLVYRERWEAAYTDKRLIHFKFPISYFQVDLYNKPCKNLNECMAVLKEMQRKQITDKGLNDVIYNFLIDERGLIYEGTGWYYHTLYQETEFLSICFFGYENNQNLSQNLGHGLNRLINYGKYYRYLHPNVTVLPRIINLTPTTPSTMTNIDKNQNKSNQSDLAEEFFIQLLNEENHNRGSKFEDEIDSKIAEDASIALDKKNASWGNVFPVSGQLNKVRLEQVLVNQTIVNQEESNKILQNRERLRNVDLKNLMESNHHEEWKKLFGDDDDDDDDE